ncbi:WD repeat-containing protein tag-125-like protein [Heracleum sosnowskyi]|uniref:WD repeat-containing protein tag-125-like protein n=1 Tax=Heracleum sosnowskyi TaxID=360622 RepID=A0AAD8MDZ6_9APIA|nr:WD repeat-containing protein tag-125-like protein [Heracleum sosnowskyi]
MEITEEPVITKVPTLAVREKRHIMNLVRSISLNNYSNSSESLSFAPPCYSSPCSPLRLFGDSPPSATPVPPPSTTPVPPPKHDKSLTAVTYKCTSSVLTKDGQILCIAQLNGAIAYTGSESNVIRIWKLPEFTEVGQLKSKAKMVVALQVSNDRVFAAYADCKIRVWSRRSCGEGTKHVRLATIPKTGSYVRSYISGKDKMMKHMAPISSIDVSLSDDLIYSASLDKTVKVWRNSDLKCIETIQAHSAPVNAIVVAENGVLYTASDDATVKVWRRNFGSDNSCLHALIVALQAKSSPVKTLTLNDDAGILYGGCADGCIHYWLKGWFLGQLQYGGMLQGHTHAILCLASFGKFVISGSADSTVRIWVKPQDGEHNYVAVLKGHRGPVKSLVAYPVRGLEDSDQDGCVVCTGSMDGVLKLWRVRCSTKQGFNGIVLD